MQTEMPKIELYRIRTFTEKLTDMFNFLRENWRPMLKYFLYLKSADNFSSVRFSPCL